MSSAFPAPARTKPFTFDRSFDDPSKVYLPGEKYGPAIEVSLPKKKAAKEDGKDSGEKDEAVEDAPPPPPPKKYTEADLEAAKEEGYINGHTVALEEAETAREHYAADALNLISQNLDDLQEQQSEANKEIGESALRMVYAVIEKVVPAHAQASAIESVEALVRDVLPLVYEEPKLIVRTHNMIADDVQARLDEVIGRSNFQGSFTVVPDYELQPGDCRVEWGGGGADRNEGRLWRDIRAIIEDSVGPVDGAALNQAADSAEPTDIQAEQTQEIEQDLETEAEPEQLAMDKGADETESDTQDEGNPADV